MELGSETGAVSKDTTTIPAVKAGAKRSQTDVWAQKSMSLSTGKRRLARVAAQILSDDSPVVDNKQSSGRKRPWGVSPADYKTTCICSDPRCDEAAKKIATYNESRHKYYNLPKKPKAASELSRERERLHDLHHTQEYAIFSRFIL